MPLISEMVHPAALGFAMQRKVVVLRDARNKTWPEIQAAVRNLRGERPSLSTVQRCYRAFSVRGGRVRTKYANCGNKVHKVTKELETFLVRRLRQLRTKMVCTSWIGRRDFSSTCHHRCRFTRLVPLCSGQARFRQLLSSSRSPWRSRFSFTLDAAQRCSPPGFDRPRTLSA